MKPTSRLVLHVDMDAFFVSVELLRNPGLRNTPVVVGGIGKRGVVAAASYEARAYGVHSALPSAIARQRCPQATFLAGDHDHYQAVSARVMAILDRFSPTIEPLSLDEAFLDISGTVHLYGDARALADALRSAVFAEEGLQCSVGIAPNKYLAKLASEAAKPTASPKGPVPGRGVVVVAPTDVASFLAPLGIAQLWGVGKVTKAKLQRIGVNTIGDLASIEQPVLDRTVGRAAGQHLADLARGRDDRPVVATREPKSLSHEMTYPDDVYDVDHLARDLLALSDSVASRLRAKSLTGRRVVLKVRFGDFTTITRQLTVVSPGGVASRRQIVSIAKGLLADVDISRGVRLIGVGVGGLDRDLSGTPEQLSMLPFFGGDEIDNDGAELCQDWEVADDAVAEIRARFGDDAIGPASLLTRKKTSPHQSTQWGPIDDVSSRSGETS